MLARIVLAVALGAGGITAGCASTPHTAQEKADLQTNAQAALNEMTQKDPGLRNVLATSAGYAIFPNVGKGGFLVGGAHGVGVLYDHGRAIGTVELNQASLGAQLGGQSFAQLVVLREPYDVARLQAGEFDLGAGYSAVALTAGAAAGAAFKNGVAVFIMPHGGAMLDVSVNGQKITYKPYA
jgi:lipid-binding SYLF domain-containing protein